ncbi:MAG TPA: methylated-DNA--[protein]-cysteine S-methyltransferase [Candidatus Eisenbacteria bacterium]|nr:methylated-DNA--[protein]-cysteine S-methyltransferase [Candidatus Eisenbacteria bacterium]
MPFLVFDTAIGPTGLAWNDAGISAIQLPEATPAKTRARLATRSPDADREATAGATPPWVTDAIGRMRAHLEGRPQDLSPVRLDFEHVTPFTARVYQALRRVPAGETVSYGDLARKVGAPGAARAIGRAMATNPFPIVVPCHRVLAAGGKAGGFSAFGGLVTKDRLLSIEKSPVRLTAATKLPYDADAAIGYLSEADPVLARHIGRIGPCALELKQTKKTFDALAEAIVHQQLNGRAAATIFARVSALCPGGHLDSNHVLATSDRALRGAGLSAAKLASLRDLAKRTEAGQVPTLAALATMDDEAIVEALTAVRGIGRWTVEMLLMFRLGRPDVLPIADFGIRKGFARVFRTRNRDDELAAPADVTKRGERWRPYRSVASWYLWRAVG